MREEGLKNETLESARMKGNFYITHTSTVAHTIMKLGLFHDEEPLLHNNFDPNNSKRRWVMNNLSPFGGNLMAVLYE